MRDNSAFRRLFSRGVQVLLYGLITVFLVNSLLQGWDQIKTYPWRVNLLWLVLAAVFPMVNAVGHGMLWTWSNRRMAIDLPYRTGVRIFLMAQLAKYVPGGVWSFANVAYSGQKLGLSGSLLTLTFILNMLLIVAASAILAAPLLPIAFPDTALRLDAVVLGGLLVAIVTAPLVLRVALESVARWRKLDTVALQVHRLTSYPALLFMFVVVLGLHLFNLASFVLFLQSSMPIAWADSLHAALAWNTAWLAGFLFLIAPSGLGVREYVLVLLLQPGIPASVATVIAVAHRVFMTAVDLLLLLGLGIEQAHASTRRLRRNNK